MKFRLQKVSSKELEKVRKARRKYGHVRKKLENVLNQNGVEQPVYHGGVLTGGLTLSGQERPSESWVNIA